MGAHAIRRNLIAACLFECHFKTVFILNAQGRGAGEREERKRERWGGSMIRGGEAEEKREVQTEVNTNEREARSGGEGDRKRHREKGQRVLLYRGKERLTT